MSLFLRAIVALALICLQMPTAAAAQGSSPPASSPQSQQERACASLPASDLAGVPDAPTHIMTTAWIAASAAAPAHCQAVGYVTPNVGIEIRLPADWNGKLTYIGCGGFCGNTFGLPGCAGPLSRGYACAMSDMGHRSTALDAKWAYNNLQAEVDFGIRATHVATLAAKAVISSFYGNHPRLSYYLGCSTGGRQGMFAAQNFPNDFDGIVAGAPVINELGDGMILLWNALATLDANGRQLFSFDDVRGVHAAVVAACDLNDGVKDGLIGDARRCRFKPRDMICTAGKKPGSCLNEQQVAALERIYRGPVNSKGQRVVAASALPGSELNWLNNYIGEGGRPSTYYKFIGDLFRYMAFIPDPGPAWRPQDFNWDQDPHRLGVMNVIYNATNPDLRQFKAAGGKLIAYQGWSDQSVLPEQVIDYYETATRTMGGPATTRDFFRLFMVPGMNHCSGGEGAYRIDYLAALEAWVERSEAPDKLLGQHPAADVGGFGGFGGKPLDPASVAFSRWHYAYPAEGRYRRGDVNSADSFSPVVAGR